MKDSYPPLSLKEALQNVLKEADGKEIDVKTLMRILAGRGYPALLVLIGLPFCFPLQIPGFSTPFGLLLAFMGIRIAFGRAIHCPEFLNKKLQYSTLEKLVAGTLKVLDKTKPFLKERWTFLARTPFLHSIHGFFVFLLGITLALPLPIPFTNILVAIPIVCLGLGLLEDDGLFVLIGYLLTIIAVAFFGSIIWYGIGYIE